MGAALTPVMNEQVRFNTWDEEAGRDRVSERSRGKHGKPKRKFPRNLRYLTWGYYTFTNKTKINYVWKTKVREVFGSS